MARKLVIPGLKIDPSAPKLATIDQAMPEQGMIALIEPGHSYEPFTGALATGVYLPNIALAQAKAQAGLSHAVGDNAYRPAISKTGTSEPSIFERSSKGGIHVAPSRAAGSSSGVQFGYIGNSRPSLENVFGTWMNSIASHSFYVAQWGRWTRLLPVLTSGGYQISQIGGSNTLGAMYGRGAGQTGEIAYPTGGSQRTGVFGENIGPIAQLAPFFIDAAWVPNLSPAPSNINASWWARINHTGSEPEKSPAMVFYDWVIEDLTVSGRTYAQAHAAWFGKYTREVKTAGGKYYNDTVPTSPAA